MNERSNPTMWEKELEIKILRRQLLRENPRNKDAMSDVQGGVQETDAESISGDAHSTGVAI